MKYPSETRGTQPFLERLKRLDEELVIAGTGGKLTMLAESGSGTLAGNAQADVFADIAAAEALEISEIFQKQFDALLLAEKFPGQPVLAYFSLGTEETTNPGEIAQLALTLSQAGYQLDPAELAEKTGLKIELKSPEPLPVSALTNRAGSWWRALWNRWITTGDGDKVFLADKNWQDHGRPDIGALTHHAIPKPDEISVAEGERQMTRGVTETDPLGNQVTFDRRTLAHFKRPDQENPAAFLPLAQATVKQPVEIWQQADNDVYIGLFRDTKGRVTGGTAMVVQKTGVAETRFPISELRKINKFRTGELIYARP